MFCTSTSINISSNSFDHICYWYQPEFRVHGIPCQFGTIAERENGHSFETSTLLISRGKCFSQMSRTELQRGQVIIHNYESWPIQGTIVLYPISSGLTRQFTRWESDSRWVNAWPWRYVCVCVCLKTVHDGRWRIQSLTQRSGDRQEDALRAENQPGSIHEWNDRITGVLENLLRWMIMLFMVKTHAVCKEKFKLFQLWKEEKDP